MKRLWIKQKAMVIAKLLAAWGYTITIVTIQPNVVHVLWVTLIHASLIGYLLAIDAMAVAFHLRMSPPTQAKFMGSRYGAEKHNPWHTKVQVAAVMYMAAFDIFRHYLVCELSEVQNIISLNISHPFTQQPVAITNQTLATGFYWTNLVFLGQVVWRMLRRKAYQYTMNDLCHFEIVGPESDAPRMLVLVKKSNAARKLVFEHADDLRQGKTVPLTLASHPGMGIVERYPNDTFPVWGSKSKISFLGVGLTAAGDNMIGDVANNPLLVKLQQGKFIVSVSDGSVLDAGRQREKLGLFLVADANKRKRCRTRGLREFKINAGGTISPLHMQHVVLGVK